MVIAAMGVSALVRRGGKLIYAAHVGGGGAARRRRLGTVGSSGEEFLDQFVNHEKKGVPALAGTDSAAGFDLSSMHRLLEALGNPHLGAWRAVHVAGTKGKGSTAAMVAEGLRASGYRVGLYTSPHVLTLRERIAVDTQPIAAAELDALVGRHGAAVSEAAAAAAAAGAPPPSHFEVLTALAFKHFAEAGVDVAVVEAGLGGARDATNVFPPEQLAAAVLTPVGLEHAAALGGGVEAIASAKAGIFKAGRPAVVARQPAFAVLRVLQDAAAARGCELVMATDQALLSNPAVEEGGRLQVADLELRGAAAAALAPEPGRRLQVRTRMVGRHQLDNAAAALTALGCLAAHGFGRVTLDAALRGLEQASLPGRFQVFSYAGGVEDEGAAAGAAAPPVSVVLDGAHTPESAAAAAATLREAFPGAAVGLVLAMASDKRHAEVCAELRAGLAPGVAVFTETPIAGGGDRTAPPGQLLGAWRAAAATAAAAGGPRRGGPCRELILPSVMAATERAASELRAARAARHRVVLVTGSLHAVGAALRSVPLGGAASGG